MSFMYTKKSLGPQTDPWCAPEIALPVIFRNNYTSRVLPERN